MRQEFVKAMGPYISVEPIECGSVNPGFMDTALAIRGARGLVPIELKVGKYVYGIDNLEAHVDIEYRADQNAKFTKLSALIRNVFVLIKIPDVGTYRYVLTRKYMEHYDVAMLFETATWYGENLAHLREVFLDGARRGAL